MQSREMARKFGKEESLQNRSEFFQKLNGGQMLNHALFEFKNFYKIFEKTGKKSVAVVFKCIAHIHQRFVTVLVPRESSFVNWSTGQLDVPRSTIKL